MHLTFVGHAQLLARTHGRHILMDPWFHDPVFGFAWWRYPPPPFPTPETLPGLDLLLLSHAHPDHSGPKTLAMMNPATPTFAPPFPSQVLERRLAKAGYTNVTWAQFWKPYEPIPGVKVTFVPHDRGWEVASMIVEADGVRLYHGNDNPLSKAGYEEIVKRLGPIDIAFLPFAGASSFPTCFDWSRKEMLEQAERKIREGIQRLTDGIEGLKPRIAVPFASNWALLEKSELWRNFVDRPTPSQAADSARDFVKQKGLSTQVLVMDPGDEWSPSTGLVQMNRTAGWGYDQPSIARWADQIEDRVKAAVAERDRSTGGTLPTPEVLDRAVHTYFDAMIDRTLATTKDLAMNAGFLADGPTGGRWHLVFEPGKRPVVKSGAAPSQEDELLTVTASEMWSIVTGRSDWEDVWYGYRLRVKKRPGAGYYRGFWEMILNFDGEKIAEKIRLEHAA